MELLARLIKSQYDEEVIDILKQETLDVSKKADVLNLCDPEVITRIKGEMSSDRDPILRSRLQAILALTYFSQSNVGE